MIVETLNQYYGGSHILRNVGFEVPAGKVTALLGRNGVGKTTLLKTLMGLVPARSGKITFENRELTRATPHVRARALVATLSDDMSDAWMRSRTEISSCARMCDLLELRLSSGRISMTRSHSGAVSSSTRALTSLVRLAIG